MPSDPDDGPLASAGRTWRLPVPYRVLIICFQALMPASAASLFFVPWSGNAYLPKPLSWLLLAGASVAWLLLAARAWRDSATLTEDTLVVRNVFRTRRLPLSTVIGVGFANAAGLVVSVGRPARRSGRRSAGRRRRRFFVPAVRVGLAYWSGRRVRADDVAEAIAAAAGLPPLSPRKALVRPGEARIDIPVGLVLSATGIALTGVSSLVAEAVLRTSGHWLGMMVAFGSMRFLVVPACAASLDRFITARRGRDGTPGGHGKPTTAPSARWR